MDVIHKLLHFIRYLGHRYGQDQCTRTAAALSYTTLLSLVPFFAVTFSILAAFPVFKELVGQIQDYIFQNFVPASGEVVQTYVQQFVKKASSLTGVGIAFLMLTALMLMATIEGALNMIWRVRTGRRMISSFMVYWSVLTLGPILLAVSLVLTSYLTSLPFLSEGGETVHTARTTLLGLMPFLSTMLAMSLLYIVVPNCNVPVRNGLAGAALAALLFEGAKKAFALYVISFPTYSKIYGALASIPLFLVWIYVSWLVVLLGAELTYCLTTFRENEMSRSETEKEPSFINAFRIIGYLWQAQKKGELLSEEQLAELECDQDIASIDANLHRLEEEKLVHRALEGGWSLSRDISEMTVMDLYRMQTQVLPDLQGSWARVDGWNKALYDVLSTADSKLSVAMAVSLKSLYVDRDDAAQQQQEEKENLKVVR